MLRKLFVATLVLTGFYAMTALVFNDCEPSYSLVLKPWPMWGWGFGGAESDCYWAATHPGVPEPWWFNAPQIVYASMEDRGGGNLQAVYLLGWFATALLWLIVLATALAGAIRRLLRVRSENFKAA